MDERWNRDRDRTKTEMEERWNRDRIEMEQRQNRDGTEALAFF